MTVKDIKIEISNTQTLNTSMCPVIREQRSPLSFSVPDD